MAWVTTATGPSRYEEALETRLREEAVAVTPELRARLAEMTAEERLEYQEQLGVIVTPATTDSVEEALRGEIAPHEYFSESAQGADTFLGPDGAFQHGMPGVVRSGVKGAMVTAAVLGGVGLANFTAPAFAEAPQMGVLQQGEFPVSDAPVRSLLSPALPDESKDLVERLYLRAEGNLAAAAGGNPLPGSALDMVPLPSDWEPVAAKSGSSFGPVDGGFVAAANSGVGGTYWGTSAWFYQDAVDVARVRLGAGNNARPVVGDDQFYLEVPRGTVLRVDDLLARFPGVTPPAMIVYDWMSAPDNSDFDLGHAMVYTRTFTSRPSGGDGTMGQGIPGVDIVDLPVGRSIDMPLTHDPAMWRSNLGILNLELAPVEYRVTVHGVGGFPQAERDVVVNGNAWHQFNNVFQSLGVTPSSDMYATVYPLDGVSWRFVAYTSNVDNVSGDPTYQQGQWHNDGAFSPQFIPVMAHLQGANGTFWTTNADFINWEGDNYVNMGLSFLGENRDNFPGGLAQKGYPFSSNQLQQYNDFVLNELGLTGKGAVIFGANVDSWTSTANVTAEGTFGQGMPGLRVDQHAVCGDTYSVMIGLQQGDAFRTNIGLVNTGTVATDATIAFYYGSGLPVRTVTRTLQPWDMQQLNQPLDGLAVTDGYAVVTSTADCSSTSTGEQSGVMAYASIVDNLSGDGTTVLAKRMSVVEPEPVYELTATLHYIGPNNEAWYSSGVTRDNGVLRAIYGQDANLDDYLGGFSMWNTNQFADLLNETIQRMYTTLTPEQIEDTFGDMFGDPYIPYFRDAMNDADGDGYHIDTMVGGEDWPGDNQTSTPENDPDGAVRALELNLTKIQ